MDQEVGRSTMETGENEPYYVRFVGEDSTIFEFSNTLHRLFLQLKETINTDNGVKIPQNYINLLRQALKDNENVRLLGSKNRGYRLRVTGGMLEIKNIDKLTPPTTYL